MQMEGGWCIGRSESISLISLGQDRAVAADFAVVFQLKTSCRCRVRACLGSILLVCGGIARYGGVAAWSFRRAFRGRLRSRDGAPDYFARRADDSAVVIDCRPAERRRPRDIEKFEATARACALGVPAGPGPPARS